MSINIYRNPFVLGLWTPGYLSISAMAVTNDFLMAAMFIFFTLGIVGAYVSEFPLFPSLYMTEMAHKVAVSSLLGMLIGMILGLAFGTTSNETHDGPMGTPRFFLAWGAMSIPAYPLMVYFVSQLNKRDLEAEAAARAEKKKKRPANYPPIMNKDGF